LIPAAKWYCCVIVRQWRIIAELYAGVDSVWYSLFPMSRSHTADCRRSHSRCVCQRTSSS